MNHPILNKLISEHLDSSAVPEAYERLFKDIDIALWQLSAETERREWQLQQESDHIKDIQAVARAGSWKLNLPDGANAGPNYWSDELFNILGVEPGTIDVSYGNYFRFVHPQDRHFFQKNVNLAIANSGKYDIEYRLIRQDGTERIVRDLGQTLTDDQGVPSKMVGITFDISEVKKMETALSEVNSDLRTLFNTMGEVFYSLTMSDGRNNELLQMSPACKIVYGYDVKEFFADPDLWFNVILDEDKHLVLSGQPNLVLGETTYSEYRIQHKNGSIRWLGSKISPTLDKDKKLIRIDGINSDITTRKEAELARMQTDLKFRALIENSMDAITVANDQFVFTFVSDSMSVITGLAPHQILGTSIFEHIHPDDHGQMRDLFGPLLAEPGKAFLFEIRIKRSDGQWRWTAGFATNLLNEPAVGGYIANFRDITERKQHETAMENSNAQLAKTNQELDRFVYSVSHDLRAPLASLSGLIDLTQSDTTDQNVLENLGMMKQSVQKLDVFILDILDYARNARMDIKIRKIDFLEMLEQIRSDLKFINAGDNSQFDIRIEIQRHDAFYSDRKRIHVILNNLISNAIRYYNPGTTQPFVEVGIHFDDLGAWLSVKDNGIGIDVAHHEKIFDMFYRVSKKSNGSGLGLYLVKETVEKLEGTIKFSSVPNEGTQFLIFLPDLATKQLSPVPE
jgi:PAS domain S-box-containing protein